MFIKGYLGMEKTNYCSFSEIKKYVTENCKYSLKLFYQWHIFMKNIRKNLNN